MSEAESTREEKNEGLLLALTTRPSQRREFLLALEEFRDRVLAEPGCARCEIYEDVTQINRFVWSEWWPDRNSAERTVHENRFRALLGAVKLLGTIESLDWVSRRRSHGVIGKQKSTGRERGVS